MTNKNGIDVNPQMFRLDVDESAANSFTEKEHNTPVHQSLEGGAALVMEILRIFLNTDEGDQLSGDSVQVEIGDRSASGMRGQDAAGVLVSYSDKTTLTTSGACWSCNPKIFDFTDGNGNGMLYAKRKMYMSVLGTNQGSALTPRASILYRMKKLTAQELVGILEDV